MNPATIVFSYGIVIALLAVLSCCKNDFTSGSPPQQPETRCAASVPSATNPGEAPRTATQPARSKCAGTCPISAIKHLIVIVQENHTFDSHFGRYCTAPPGSRPTCNIGPDCCEAAPPRDPSGTAAIVLTDSEHARRSPDNSARCQTYGINDGRMDRFATAPCGNPKNVAYADASTVKPYWDLARAGALADRYFQPVVGASSANDMYLARAAFVFNDNRYSPRGAIGTTCAGTVRPAEYGHTTIGDLLDRAGVSWAFYAEGYQAMVSAVAMRKCPPRPEDCPYSHPRYPCVYDPTDVPFQYYPSLREKHMRDFSTLGKDLADGTLPAVAYVKAIGYHSEHPGKGTKLSSGVAFVNGIVEAVRRSQYGNRALVLLTYDEGGGYFDHISPPPPSPGDGKAYGTRVPLLAIGPFAKTNYVSHVVMEHSSIVKFIEWNWLGATGQLKTRDAVVANLGSLLDPSATGTPVPEH